MRKLAAKLISRKETRTLVSNLKAAVVYVFLKLAFKQTLNNRLPIRLHLR